jgi:hypothetical protein
MAENTARAGQPAQLTDAQLAGQPAEPETALYPGNHSRMNESGLRVSDAERDAVAAELAEHLKDGRLQVAEFDERVGRAIGARTRGDLDGLLSDLPRLTPPQPPAPDRARLPFPLAAIPIFVVGMVVLGGISHAAAGGGGHQVWAIWPLWWLIPIAIFVARRRRLGSHRPQG